MSLTKSSPPSKARKQDYDQFFNPSYITNEKRYFHHYVDEDQSPLKMKLKIYEDDEVNCNLESLLFTMEHPEKDIPNTLILSEDDRDSYRESLLEVPVERLKREILETIIEEREQRSNEEAERAAEEQIAIENNTESTANKPIDKAQTLLWSDRYMPYNFHELLSDERVNREALTWLKSWDPIVFRRKVKKTYF